MANRHKKVKQLLKEKGRTTRELQELTNYAPNSINVALTELVKQGEIVRVHHGYYMHPDNIMWLDARARLSAQS